MAGYWRIQYGQRKPEVDDWTCEAHSVIPNNLDSFQKSGVLKVEFSLHLTRPVNEIP